MEQPPELVEREPADRAVLVLFGLLLPLPVVRVLDPVVRLVVAVIVGGVVRVGVDLGPQEVRSGVLGVGQRGGAVEDGVVALMVFSLLGTAGEGAGGFFPRILWAGKKSCFVTQGV